jgi:hypothetical protein
LYGPIRLCCGSEGLDGLAKLVAVLLVQVNDEGLALPGEVDGLIGN